MLAVLSHDSPLNCDVNSSTICVPTTVDGTVMTPGVSRLQVASRLWLSCGKSNSGMYKVWKERKKTLYTDLSSVCVCVDEVSSLVTGRKAMGLNSAVCRFYNFHCPCYYYYYLASCLLCLEVQKAGTDELVCKLFCWKVSVLKLIIKLDICVLVS